METIKGYVSTKFARGNEKYHQVSVSVRQTDGSFKFITAKAFAKNQPDAYKALKRLIDHDYVEIVGNTVVSEWNGKTYATFICSTVVLK